MVRKIWSFQTIGVELPEYSSLIFHLTFWVALHLRGRFFSKHCPCPVGPRQAGQSSASVIVLKINIANPASRRLMMHSFTKVNVYLCRLVYPQRPTRKPSAFSALSAF